MREILSYIYGLLMCPDIDTPLDRYITLIIMHKESITIIVHLLENMDTKVVERKVILNFFKQQVNISKKLEKMSNCMQVEHLMIYTKLAHCHYFYNYDTICIGI